MSDNGLKSLKEALQKLISLQKIFLKFRLQNSRPRITDNGLMHLGQGIKKLTALKSIKFNFSGLKEQIQELVTN